MPIRCSRRWRNACDPATTWCSCRTVDSTARRAVSWPRARAAERRSPMLREAPLTLGLFPLHSVLLPGSTLSLRVFERRYLELVSECMRESRGFGVCLILIGDEVGMPATPAKIRQHARIEISHRPDGLLHLRIRGGRRFAWRPRTCATRPACSPMWNGAITTRRRAAPGTGTARHRPATHAGAGRCERCEGATGAFR